MSVSSSSTSPPANGSCSWDMLWYSRDVRAILCWRLGVVGEVEGVDYDRWNELNKRKTEEHDQNRLKGESTGSSIGHDFGKENKNASGQDFNLSAHFECYVS